MLNVLQFVSLASEILNFLSAYFVNTPDVELQNLIKSTLNEDHMSNLAILIKELDKDCLRVSNGKNDHFSVQKLMEEILLFWSQYIHIVYVIVGKTFDSLSMALAKFNHGLISTGILSENLQVNILTTCILSCYIWNDQHTPVQFCIALHP